MSKIKVGGMSCQHCVKSVTEALQNVDGVINVNVSLDTGQAEYDEDHPVNRDDLVKAIEKIGFTVEG